MDILGLEKVNSELSNLKKEINLLKVKEATFEERFQRIADQISEVKEAAIKNNEAVKELRSWSIGWRNAVIISLITVIVQLVLIPLVKSNHLFNL